MHQQLFQSVSEGTKVLKQGGPGLTSGIDHAERAGMQPLIPQGTKQGNSSHAQKRTPRQPGKVEPATQHHCHIHDQLWKTLDRPSDPTDVIRQRHKDMGSPSLLGAAQRGPQDLRAERQGKIQNRVLAESDQQNLGPEVGQNLPGHKEDKPHHHDEGIIGGMMKDMINER